MRLCTVRGAEIRLHPLLLVAAAGACVLGRLYALLQACLALTLHEAGHALAAAAFGCRITAMELQPFGAALRMEQGDLSPHAEWCVALTGPVTSFILAGAAATVSVLSPATGARMEPFLTFNLTLGLINLLPALPLDGGRAAKCALLQSLGLSAAVKITGWAGVASGAAMLGLTLLLAARGVHNPTLPMMGAFLLLAAVAELRALPEKRLASLLRHGRAMGAEGSMPVREIAARGGMEAREALRLLLENRYNVIRVVDGSLRTLGELDEQALLTGMVRLGSRACVAELLGENRSPVKNRY